MRRVLLRRAPDDARTGKGRLDGVAKAKRQLVAGFDGTRPCALIRQELFSIGRPAESNRSAEFIRRALKGGRQRLRHRGDRGRRALIGAREAGGRFGNQRRADCLPARTNVDFRQTSRQAHTSGTAQPVDARFAVSGCLRPNHRPSSRCLALAPLRKLPNSPRDRLGVWLKTGGHALPAFALSGQKKADELAGEVLIPVSVSCRLHETLQIGGKTLLAWARRGGRLRGHARSASQFFVT